MSDTEPWPAPRRSVSGVRGHPTICHEHRGLEPDSDRCRTHEPVATADETGDDEPQDRGQLAREDDGVDRYQGEDRDGSSGVAHHKRNWPVRRSQKRATKPRAKPIARKIQVRIVVSGSVKISTAIQMIMPTPSVPVSQGAIQ
jgi:hypothetical protein